MTMTETVRSAFAVDVHTNPQTLPALTLAYVGDTVYDLFVRTYLLDACDAPVHVLHNLSAKMVCAKGQATAFHHISPLLTEEELAAFKRGRNAHSGTIPKNAKVTEYRIATGLEALLGFLYLSGADERLHTLMEAALQSYTNIQEKEE